MDSFTQYRDRIGQTLTLRLADAMESGHLTEDETVEIADTILKGVNDSNNHEGLVAFLDMLAHKWTLFGPVLISEQSQMDYDEAKVNDQEAVEKVESLLKENKIDEAIFVAEKANDESAQHAEDQSNTTPAPENQPQSEQTTENQQQGGNI